MHVCACVMCAWWVREGVWLKIREQKLKRLKRLKKHEKTIKTQKTQNTKNPKRMKNQTIQKNPLFPSFSDMNTDCRVREIKNRGRGVVATTNLNPGTEIFSSLPYTKLTCGKYRASVCDHCLKPTTKKCAGCKWFCYCSKSCQVSAWKSYHKHECKLLKQASPETPDFVLFLARVMFHDDHRKTMEHLESNLEKLSENEKTHVGHQITVLRVYLDQVFGKYVHSAKEAMALVCRLKNNMFVIMSEDCAENELAMAIYPEVAMMNHQCRNNCSHVFTKNGRIQIGSAEILWEWWKGLKLP